VSQSASSVSRCCSVSTVVATAMRRS
jgi:hypothetical protein